MQRKSPSAQANEATAATAKFVTLHSFSGPDGANPFAALVQANGDFYGTTGYGGGSNCPQPTTSLCGTIFKITPSGALTTLYGFCSQVGCPDGIGPNGLVQATNGNLYGTTFVGGAGGGATVFKVTPTGALTTLYSFSSESTSMATPIQAANGDLYGTTGSGGTYNAGTIFKITPAGALTTLYTGCSYCTDPNVFLAGLVQATNGSLYGTTYYGGVNCGPLGCGTIFKITPSGTLTTLYSFCSQAGCTDGARPIYAPIQATNGDFYETTLYGGANCTLTTNCGTIFKMSPGGTLTTLYSFCSQTGCTDGYSASALIQASSGNLYGTILFGGAYGKGTIFKITPTGTLTTLYSFCSQTGCPDGASPTALVQGTNGVFYGTTPDGGANGDGTVFALSTGQAPFVMTRPTIGKVGEAVTILGYKLTGATSVTFNGIAATFTVISSTEITTTVPAGATTGKVQVTTPSGTLTSNIAFEVAP